MKTEDQEQERFVHRYTQNFADKTTRSSFPRRRESSVLEPIITLKKNSIKLRIPMFLSINLIISFPTFASGGSALEISLYFFVWFSIIGWVVSSFVKHHTQKRKDTMYIRLVRILPITILASPSFYIESSDAMLFPSAATVFLSIDPFNGASLISGFISIILTTLAIYAYKYKKTETMQDYNVTKDK